MVPGTTAQSAPGMTPAAPGTARDGTAGNPPSTATQRATDSITGNRTPADGTPGNPPGTAAGRAVDRALGTNTTGANPAAPAAPTATGAATGTLAVDSGALHNGRRASKLIGSAVYNENNESIGEVDDILIPAGGSGPVAVISVGGFLGIGAKLVAVPYERLQAAGGSNNRWTLSGATKDSLGSLPTFNYDNSAEKRG
jgi:sporulation protein YlmC with PRC-barrel domain